MADMVLAGIVLALLGIGVMAASLFSSGRRTGGEMRGEGVIMIGPVPIIFGSDARWASAAIVLAIVLVLLALLLNLA